MAHVTHGRRLYDTLREYCGITDEKTLLSEITRFEEEVIQGGPVALPGAHDIIHQVHNPSHSKNSSHISPLNPSVSRSNLEAPYPIQDGQS